jgi:EAL domain-containing protein (putative c-di-GMP-specific phosphodiesterase class I)
MEALGCEGAQGHFFAEPSDAGRIAELAHAGAAQPA